MGTGATMRKKRVLAVMAFGCAALTAGTALADVTFVGLGAFSVSSAQAWNGIRPSPVYNSNLTRQTTPVYSTGVTGLTASHTVNAISGTGSKQVVGTDTETVFAQLASTAQATFAFTGSTSLTFGPDAGAGASGFAGAGGDTQFNGLQDSRAGYAFTLTTPEVVSISYTTQGNNPLADAYYVSIYDSGNGNLLDDYYVPSSLAVSAGWSSFALGAGNYAVDVEQQPTWPGSGFYAPDYIESSANAVGSASAQFNVTIPESPTWAMLLGGFAALAAFGALPKLRPAKGREARSV